jgi:hypothetical protein
VAATQLRITAAGTENIPIIGRLSILNFQVLGRLSSNRDCRRPARAVSHGNPSPLTDQLTKIDVRGYLQSVPIRNSPFLLVLELPAGIADVFK